MWSWRVPQAACDRSLARSGLDVHYIMRCHITCGAGLQHFIRSGSCWVPWRIAILVTIKTCCRSFIFLRNTLRVPKRWLASDNPKGVRKQYAGVGGGFCPKSISPNLDGPYAISRTSCHHFDGLYAASEQNARAVFPETPPSLLLYSSTDSHLT